MKTTKTTLISQVSVYNGKERHSMQCDLVYLPQAFVRVAAISMHARVERVIKTGFLWEGRGGHYGNSGTSGAASLSVFLIPVNARCHTRIVTANRKSLAISNLVHRIPPTNWVSTH